jgi:hypothetical protein
MAPVMAGSSVDDAPNGAVLELKAKDPAQLPALRDQVRINTQAMQTGCPNPR